MGFANELFLQTTADETKLLAFGFRKCADGSFQYTAPILFGRFQALVTIADGKVEVQAFDSDQVEYTLIQVPTANGEFVCKVRDACVLLLEQIRDACFSKRRYLAEQTAQIVAEIAERYHETADDPWEERYPEYGVFRYAENKKWYALLMKIDGTKIGREKGSVEILNVKCAPEILPTLLQQDGYHPAYHMNRQHWVTIRLDGTLPNDTILERIEESRNSVVRKR